MDKERLSQGSLDARSALDGIVRRCESLSEPIVRRMAHSLRKRLCMVYADQVEDNLAARKMDFFDQMAIMHMQNLSYYEFRFGFEDCMDEILSSLVDSLPEQDRFILDSRHPELSEKESRQRIFSDVKDAFATILEERYNTGRMQKMRTRYDWLVG